MALEKEFAGMRAGRATPAILDKISVDYYGVPTPIQQMAAVSVSEGRVLVIQPWDASVLSEIEKAINKSEIGITPQNDGKVIRLAFPQPTEERRKELAKGLSKKTEDAKVNIRGVRRDAMDFFKKAQKNSEITEDDQKNAETKIQKITDEFIKEIDTVANKKEKEIMEI